MTKEDFILEAALRLILVYPDAENIPIIAKKLASDLFEDDSNDKHTKFDIGLYNSLIKELREYFNMPCNVTTNIADALMRDKTTVNLETASALANAYASIRTTVIKDALRMGEIEGIVPPTEKITICETMGRTYTRQQGKRYHIQIDSLILWLDKNYLCKINPETITYKMLLRTKARHP